jgi:hypothetical protein
MAGHEGERVKLEDIIRDYRNRNATSPTKAKPAQQGGRGEESDEDENYHFDRWVWYMERHLDSDGYIVPQSKTLEEWIASGTGTETAAKTAATRVSNWTFRAPSTSGGGYAGIGRIQAITFHPTDSNTYWVGTAGGGAWKTTNDGGSWTCMTDMLPVLGVADILINPRNPKTMYLATGDRDNGGNYSIGILKSTDGGLTWNTTGHTSTLQQARVTASLIMNPYDTATLILAASTGLYKTSNAGASWTLMKAGNFKQVLYRPADSNRVFATGQPLTGGACAIYRSVNAGNTWDSTLQVSGSSRIAIAISAAAPNSLKAVAANGAGGLDGIYSSVDTGHSFAKIFSGADCSRNILNGGLFLSVGTCGGQGAYDLAIAIDPTDSNKVLVGGINTWQSTDGGLSWTIVTAWYSGLAGLKVVHADKHVLVFQPLRPKLLFEGNDGGIYKTANPASMSWTDLSNGLGITQFYCNAVSNGADFVLGGAQDNGTKKIDFTGRHIDVNGGDGMRCAIDYSDSSITYTSTQNGPIYRNVGKSGNVQISSNIPGKPDGLWITPYLIDPKVPKTLYAGYDKVYRSTDRGNTWTAISPQFISKIDLLATSPAASGTIYAGVSGILNYTTNGGTSWSTHPLAFSLGISDIVVSHKNARNFWLTYEGYNTRKVYEYDTVDGWINRTANLPNIPVNCITIDTSSGTVYIGSDAAVYYLDSSKAWQLFNNKLPAAEITDLSINYKTGVLWAATYGRGMWESPKRDFVAPPKSIVSTPAAEPALSISPNPTLDGTLTLRTGLPQLQAQEVQITILDMEGRTVWTHKAHFSSSGILQLRADTLSPGQYTLKVQAETGTTATAKLSVL